MKVAPPDRVPLEGETIYGRVTVRSISDYVIDPESGCWLWQKFVNKHGYPSGRVYRLYYERAHGPIPDGHDVHHTCKTRHCVNPDHLEAVSERGHDVHHWLDDRGLTLEQVNEIRELGRQPGMTSHEVGRRYGIPESVVRDYWRGRRWANETGGEIIRPVGRKCAHCDGEIAPERNRKALYCDKRCKTAAGKKRTKERAT